VGNFLPVKGLLAARIPRHVKATCGSGAELFEVLRRANAAEPAEHARKQPEEGGGEVSPGEFSGTVGGKSWGQGCIHENDVLGQGVECCWKAVFELFPATIANRHDHLSVNFAGVRSLRALVERDHHCGSETSLRRVSSWQNRVSPVKAPSERGDFWRGVRNQTTGNQKEIPSDRALGRLMCAVGC